MVLKIGMDAFSLNEFQNQVLSVKVQQLGSDSVRIELFQEAGFILKAIMGFAFWIFFFHGYFFSVPFGYVDDASFSSGQKGFVF